MAQRDYFKERAVAREWTETMRAHKSMIGKLLHTAVEAHNRHAQKRLDAFLASHRPERIRTER
ncbi:MAG: hypothetical protein JWR75_148 [Devosia sp.]|nr:hypothetical protein [Devosia sp.]